MDNSLSKVIAGILEYSFQEIEWKYDGLTETEKEIVQNQENMDAIKAFAEAELAK